MPRDWPLSICFYSADIQHAIEIVEADAVYAADKQELLSRLERQTKDVQRAEIRDKHSTRQQTEFQKKMMQAMGRLYHDKSEVAPLQPEDLECASEGSMWLAMLAVFHQIVAMLYSVFGRFVPKQPKLKDA